MMRGVEKPWRARIFLGVACLTLGSLVNGCVHARHVDKPGKSGQPAAAADAEGGPQARLNPRQPLVVDSPEKLLRPGGGRLIQEALRAKDYLIQETDQELGETTIAILQRYQEATGLAATGFPDAETVRSLGLSPDEVYKNPLSRQELIVLRRERKTSSRESESER